MRHSHHTGQSTLAVGLLVTAVLCSLCAALCVPGWTEFLSISVNGTVPMARCAQLQLMQLPAIDVEYVCQNVLRLSGTQPNLPYRPTSFAARTANDNIVALSLSRPAWPIIAANDPRVVFLGGTAGFGAVNWFDGSNATFGNITSGSTDSSGCLGLAVDGSWMVVPCTTLSRPFLCAYDQVVIPTPPPPSPPPSPPGPAPVYAPRPPISLPAPPCLAGWSWLASSGKCYKYVTDAYGGLPQQLAESNCTAWNPNGALTSVLAPDEAAFIAGLIAASQSALSPMPAFVGGVFMDYGSMGAWYEDSVWYPNSNWTTASPSWPTPVNQYYSGWKAGEPSLSFGCIALDSTGAWVARSCQDTLPFVCSYLNNGVTWPPSSSPPPASTTTPPNTTAAPAEGGGSGAVWCASGWSASSLTRRCYRVITSPQVSPADMEATCNAALNVTPVVGPPLSHAAPCMSDAENDILTSLVSPAGVASVAIGVSFTGNGTGGMCMDGLTDYSPDFALRHFDSGQPAQPGGCTLLLPTGRWKFAPCTVAAVAIACYYSFDQYAASVAPPPTPLPSTPTPTPLVVALPQRIAALNNVTSLVVLRGTVGTYVVSSAGGPVDGLLFLFSPSATSCAGNTRSDLVAQVRGNRVQVQHTIATTNGTVCVSPDGGTTFLATAIRVSVVNAPVTGAVFLSQSLYAPPLKRQPPFAPSEVLTTIVLPRRSPSTIQLVSPAPALLDQAVSWISLSSSSTCRDPMYTIAEQSMAVRSSMFSLQTPYYQPQSPAAADPFRNDTQYAPPETYFVCVAASLSGGSSSVRVFTRVPNMTVSIAPEPLSVTGLFLIDSAGNPLSDSSSATTVVPQYSSPRLALQGGALPAGAQVLLSYDRWTCSRQQAAPSSSLATPDSAPLFINTMAPVSFALMNTDSDDSTPSVLNAYVQLNVNHTGLYGVDVLVASQELFVCIAHSAAEAFWPAGLTITVQRQIISALSGNDAIPATADYVANTGFSGLLRIWGMDTRLWSTETLSNAQIGFAQAPTGSAPIGPIATQCQNVSTFYNLRALSLVGESLATNGTSALQTSQVSAGHYSTSFVVIPPGFFVAQSARRMRLCLSVPRMFDSPRRVFTPTTATLDVRPIQLLFLGRYGASSSTGLQGPSAMTTIRIPQMSDNVVLAVLGYGISSDMTFFLSATPCFSLAGFPADPQYLSRTSRLNISISVANDIPLPFQNTSVPNGAAQPKNYLTLTQEHTNTDLADRIFGSPVRTPLLICIWAPTTQNLVYPTPFQLVVERPLVSSIALGNGAPAVVTYGSYLDLVVTGTGLQEMRTVLIPALDCSNTSSYLWRVPVGLSPVPSVFLQSSEASTQRFIDRQTGNASFFLPLNQQQTCRIGTVMPPNGVLSRFQWCVNFDTTDSHYRFEPTGIPYQLVIPATDGFVTNPSKTVTTSLTVPQEDRVLGQWTQVTITGALVSLAATLGNQMFIFLSQTSMPCATMKNFILLSNSTDRMVVAINGTMLLLPAHIGSPGRFKLCASFLYPPQQSVQVGVEAALQFVELLGLTVSVVAPVFKLFTVNGSLSVSVEQGSSPLLPVDGLGLSARARLRLMPSSAVAAGAPCGSLPMPSGLSDIVVRPTFPGQAIGSFATASFYIALDHWETLRIPVNSYVVCLLGNAAQTWTATNIRINVVPHLRRPTVYAYFSDNTSYDVAVVQAVPTAKVVQPWSSGQLQTVNIVGTIGRMIAVQLLCYTGGAGPAQPCGDNKRVMFVRPLPSGDDPCFVDDLDEEWQNTIGPFVLHYGVLNVPASVTLNSSTYPTLNNSWVMCVETQPSYWHRPMTPNVLLQYSSLVVTGVRPTADNVSNTTAIFPSSSGGGGVSADSTMLTLYAGDVSQAFFLNGFGIQAGIRLRFGLGCDNNSASASHQTLSNPMLFSSPVTVGDDYGSFILASMYFAVAEVTPVPMCAADIGGPFVMTTVQLQVLPSRILADPLMAVFNNDNGVTVALRSAIVVPLQSRGLIDVSLLAAPATGTSVVLGTGSLVMFSSNCLYNSHGLPILQVQNGSFVSISYRHTSTPTPSPLRVCVRRLRSLRNQNGTFVTAYEGAFFTDSQLQFKVVNVSLTSVSVHQQTVGIEAQRDIKLMLFGIQGRLKLLPLTFAFRGNSPPATDATSAPADILSSFDDVAVLALLQVAVFRVGRPCHIAAPSAAMARVGTMSAQTGTFSGGVIFATSASITDGFHVPLRVDQNFVADPWDPYSLCFSVDGGRFYTSVGVAYFTATWAPTLYVLDPSAGFTQQITIFEATSVEVPFTDSRYDARILDNTADSFVDSDLSRLLNSFTVMSLWNGNVGGAGFVTNGVLYLPSEIVLDGENVSDSLARTTASATPASLRFSFDSVARNIDTGVTLSVAPMSLRCLEGNATVVLVNRLEAGRTFSASLSGGCNLGINDGAVLRLSSTPCGTPTFAADAVIDASYNLAMPAVLPFLADGSYQVCLRKTLPLRFAQVLQMESEYLATSVSLQLSQATIVDQVNDVSSGSLVAFHGEPFMATLAGAGVTSSSLIVSIASTQRNATAAQADPCSAVTGYVNAQGTRLSSSALLDWYPAVRGVFTISAAANSVGQSLLGSPFQLCVSVDFGLSFYPVGQGLLYTVLPPVVTGVATAVPPGYQLWDPKRMTPTVMQLQRLSVDESVPLSTSVPVKFARPNAFLDYFLNRTSFPAFLGNGIGARSRRAAPLVVALVDSTVVGYRCSGQALPPAALLATATIDSRTGAVLSSKGLGSLVAGQRGIVCTSVDGRLSNYYSANWVTAVGSAAVPVSSAIPSSEWVSRLNQYTPWSLQLVQLPSTTPTRLSWDLVVSLRCLVVRNASGLAGQSPLPTNGINSWNLTLGLLQSQLASALGYSPAAVAIATRWLPAQPFGGATCASLELTVKLLAEGYNATAQTTLSVPFMYVSLLRAITSNTSTVLQYLIGGVPRATASVVALFVNITADDGTPIRDAVLADGGGTDPLSVQILRAMPEPLINGNRLNDLSSDDLQPKAKWSAIPLVILLPFLMVFGTYNIFLRYFDIVTPEEEAARNAQIEEDIRIRREQRTRAIRGELSQTSADMLSDLAATASGIAGRVSAAGGEVRERINKGVESVAGAMIAGSS